MKGTVNPNRAGLDIDPEPAAADVGMGWSGAGRFEFLSQSLAVDPLPLSPASRPGGRIWSGGGRPNHFSFQPATRSWL